MLVTLLVAVLTIVGGWYLFRLILYMGDKEW